MHSPTLIGSRAIAADTYELTSYMPVPGLGILPVNAFLLDGPQPILVDTGLAALREAFLQALERLVDPAALRWIWISHLYADHTGNLLAILERAPDARIVTSFLGMGKMMLQGLPVDRVHLLEPGSSLSAGVRELVPLRPAVYDAPETLGFFEPASRLLFTADAFGTLMQEPAEEAGAIPEATLAEGMTRWAAVDAPWLSQVEPGRFGQVLRALEALDPAVIVSGHLPAARGMTGHLLRHLAAAQDAMPGDPFAAEASRSPATAA